MIAYQIVNPLACSVVDEAAAELALDCSLAWAIVLMLVGFAGAFVGTLFLLKVARKAAAWLAMMAGLFWLAVGAAGIGEWWWILLAVLLPALAALASAPWPRFGRAALAGLALLLVAGIGVLGWQLASG